MKEQFNKLPNGVQILIYNAVSQLLAYILDVLASGQIFSWRSVLIIVIGAIFNVVAYLRTNIK